MGKVLNTFLNGSPGAVSRAVDDIIIAVKNAGSTEIPFGAPVFLASGGSGAVPFSTASPQSFASFLGFAVRIADKTPDAYPSGQDYAVRDTGAGPQGTWKPGDVMEVLVRGTLAVAMASAGEPGGNVYLRKSDGKLTPAAGAEGTTVLLENVRIRRPRGTAGSTCEVVVNKRNVF